MQALSCNRTRCHVCGFTEIRIDEAVDREVLVLAECPRCDHRWIGAPGSSRDPVRSVSVTRMPPEVASAA
jgi:predicted Zn-ribbon and HTH transcriptional regulator